MKAHASREERTWTTGGSSRCCQGFCAPTSRREPRQLLARCLAILDADVRDEAAGSESGCRVVELDDADLELLAAAGDGACAGEPAAPESGRW